MKLLRLSQVMNIVRFVILALQLSIFLTVCSLGMQASMADAICLFRRPSVLFRSLLAMNVLMPVIATAAALMFNLHPAVKVALVFLAVSPVPPILPRAQSKLGGSAQLICGLLAATALLSIILVPLTLELLAIIFAREILVSPGAVAKVMATSVLLPLALGILIRRLSPGLAQRATAPLSGIAFLLLLACVAILLVASLPRMGPLFGNGTVLAIAVFVAAGVAVGHWLGGPDPAYRSTLALATASRHPGLAIVLAGANFPGQRQTIAAAVLLYLLVKALVLIPYNSWQKHRLASISDQRGAEPKQRAA